MDAIKVFCPNVFAYSQKLIDSLLATWSMFYISGIFIVVIGLILGVVIVVTKKGAIMENILVYEIVDKIVSIFRSIPFVILLIFLIPFTRFVVGTAIGVKGAIIPLIMGAVPFFTRQVEAALSKIEQGKIDAAKAMGSSNIGIIFRIYLQESVPDIARAITITAISLMGLTTMAGAVGAGGIGSFAINYGQNLHHQDIVNVSVIILLIVVCIIQGVGNYIASRTTNHKLF